MIYCCISCSSSQSHILWTSETIPNICYEAIKVVSSGNTSSLLAFINSTFTNDFLCFCCYHVQSEEEQYTNSHIYFVSINEHCLKSMGYRMLKTSFKFCIQFLVFKNVVLEIFVHSKPKKGSKLIFQQRFILFKFMWWCNG